MTKFYNFLFLLVAIAFGGGNLWAEDISSPWSCTFKTGGDVSAVGQTTVRGVTLNLSQDSQYFLAENNDLHFGSGSFALSYVKVNSSSFANYTITKVVVNARGASKTTGVINVSVGGQALGEEYSLTSTLADYTFEGSAQGDLEITLTQSSTTKALYLASIEVTFSAASGPAKTATTVSFGNDDKQTIEVVKGSESEFTAPTANVMADGQAVAGAAVVYSSDNTDVATVDSQTGNITFGTSTGTAKITATYAGSDSYTSSASYYNIEVKPAPAIASLTNGVEFDIDGMTDGMATSAYANQEDKDWSFTTTDNASWTFHIDASCCNSASGLQMKKGNGQFTSPEINSANGFVVVINIPSDKTTLPTITSGSVSSEAFDAHTVKLIVNSTKASFVVKASSSGATYIKSMSIYPIVPITESAAVPTTATSKASVQLTRTISADYWNTICLPFAMTAEQVEDVFGAGTTITEFSNVSGNVLNFTAASSIEAAKPYLIKAGATAADPRIDGVDVAATTDCNPMITQGNYAFVGTLEPYTMATDGTELFVTTSGKLSAPAAATKTISGLRAFFMVPEGSEAKLHIADEADGIATVHSQTVAEENVIYDLMGRRLAQPRGLYIMNGKKHFAK